MQGTGRHHQGVERAVSDPQARIKEVFLQVEPLTPAERQATLDRELGDAPELRAHIERLLLASDDRNDTFLQPLVATREPVGIGEHEIPRQVGPYRVESVLGRGGMACVFRARQLRPIERTVALKVLRPGFDTAEVLRRFNVEQQVLAHLQHRNIATVLDAGADPQGPSYFAMEVVNGPPITTFCEERNLSPEERLRLFVQVCRGVQHAHLRGVLHRDLKPSNILVAVEDGEAVPKIIDFGVAKALGMNSILQGPARTLSTQIVGTLEYMSPEQAEFGNPDIDARADVYSLGVVLYEMLTARLPIPLDAGEGRSLAELQRRIQVSRPPRPSEAALGLTLSRELDCVVLKALEKDRNLRYDSAKDLADEIERFLSGQPLSVRPPTRLYLISKFTARNRLLVGAIAALAATLVLGLVGTSIGMFRSIRIAAALQESLDREKERERVLERIIDFQTSSLAEVDIAALGLQIREVLLEEMAQSIQSSDPRDPDLLAGINFSNVALRAIDAELLQATRTAVDEQFAGEPLVRAELLSSLANIHDEIGLYDRAEEIARTATGLLAHERGPDHPDTLQAETLLAEIIAALGRHHEALTMLERVSRLLAATVGEDDARTINARANLGVVLARLGRHAEAEPLYASTLAQRQQHFGPDDPQTLQAMSNMGSLLVRLGRNDEAEAHFRAAFEGHQRRYSLDHRYTITAMHNLAGALHARGQSKEAADLLQTALDRGAVLLGNNHPIILTIMNSLAAVRQTLGETGRAVELLREALQVRRRLLGDRHVETLRSMANLGLIIDRLGQGEEAEALLRESYQGRMETLGPDHPDTIASTNHLGVLHASRLEFETAEPYYRRAYESSVRINGPEAPTTLIAMSNLAGVLARLGRFDESNELGLLVLATADRVLPQGHWHRFMYQRERAKVLATQSRWEEAEAHFLLAVEGFRTTFSPTHPHALETANEIARFYGNWAVATGDDVLLVEANRWRVTSDEEDASLDTKAKAPSATPTATPSAQTGSGPAGA